MNSLYLLCICALLVLCVGIVVTAAPTFTLRDYTHHTWTNELVTYQVKMTAKLSSRAVLQDSAGTRIPMQVRRLSGGMYEVAFIVAQLPADGQLTYTVLADTPLPATPMARAEQDSLVLDAGVVAARVPLVGNIHMSTPVPLAKVSAPLLAVRGCSGTWLGAGRLLGELPVTAMATTLVADGPVYAETRTDYTVQGGGSYTVFVRVVRGQEAVFVREEYNLPMAQPGSAYFSFSLTEGLQPDRVSTSINKWRKRTEEQPSALGLDYKLDFDQPRMEMSILGFVNWWPETARRATFYRSGNPDGDALSVLPARIGRWRNPMGMYVMTGANGKVSLDLPLFIDQKWERDGVVWGGRYYTGKLEAGWPRSAGRREWILHCAPVKTAVAATGRPAVIEAVCKYCDLPLDKIKDWTLEWPADPKITYPRLYVEPGKLATVQARAKANSRWMARFGQYDNRPVTYTITQDAKIGRDLINAPSMSPQWSVPNNSQGSIQSLRSYVNALFDTGYMGNPAPNNATPMNELVRFDAAMSVQVATPAEKAEMRHLMAFIANMVYDEDWEPVRSGFHLGNPNMPPRQEHHLAVASCVLPDHPLAPAWRKRGEAQAKWMIDNMVRDGGSWRECPHYQYEAAMFPLFEAAIPVRYAGGQDLFTQPKLKSTWDYLLNICTPPDPRFGTRILPAFGNGSWEEVPLFGWLANLTRTQDPVFSKRMQWMWLEHGKPDWLPFSETLLDPTLPAEQPVLESKNFPGFGAILRNGFPSRDETWVAFRMGEDHEHYNFGDQGSFMFYAKGAPLVLQFGSQYQPLYRGAWYFNRVSIGHQEIQPGLFGGTEQFDDSNNTEYPGKMIGFAGLQVADYAVGRHISRRQGLVPDDTRTPMPPNSALVQRDIAEHTWTRQMLLMKSLATDGQEDPDGPAYLVMRDSITSAQPLPTEWNLWVLAENVDTTANPARCASPFGVQMDVFLAEPAGPRWAVRQDSHTFLAGPTMEYWRKVNGDKPWKETLTNLRAYQQPGKGYLAVLYPRKANEAPAQYTTLSDGNGVKVTHPRGEDVVFLGLSPVTWAEGACRFSGAAGAIRREHGQESLILFATGEVSNGAIALKADNPASLRLTGRAATLRTDGLAQTVQLILPPDAMLKVNGKPMKATDGVYRIAVKSGKQQAALVW